MHGEGAGLGEVVPHGGTGQKHAEAGCLDKRAVLAHCWCALKTLLFLLPSPTLTAMGLENVMIWCELHVFETMVND